MTVTTMCDDKDHWRRPPLPPYPDLLYGKRCPIYLLRNCNNAQKKMRNY